MKQMSFLSFSTGGGEGRGEGFGYQARPRTVQPLSSSVPVAFEAEEVGQLGNWASRGGWVVGLGVKEGQLGGANDANCLH